MPKIPTLKTEDSKLAELCLFHQVCIAQGWGVSVREGGKVQMERKFSLLTTFPFSPLFVLKGFLFTFPLQEKENFPLKTLLDMELDCDDVGGCLTLVIFYIQHICKCKCK